MSDKHTSEGNGIYPQPKYDTGGQSVAGVRASRRQFIKGVIASGAAVTSAHAVSP